MSNPHEVIGGPLLVAMHLVTWIGVYGPRPSSRDYCTCSRLLELVTDMTAVVLYIQSHGFNSLAQLVHRLKPLQTTSHIAPKAMREEQPTKTGP